MCKFLVTLELASEAPSKLKKTPASSKQAHRFFCKLYLLMSVKPAKLLVFQIGDGDGDAIISGPHLNCVQILRSAILYSRGVRSQRHAERYGYIFNPG
jgi:hypothetical protein